MNRIELLEADPDLGARLSPDDFAEARRELLVPVREYPCGGCPPEFTVEEDSVFALLVLDGAFGFETWIGERSNLEIVLEGSVIQPWRADPAHSSIRREMRWSVLTENARVGVLGREFARAAPRWLGLGAGLVDRSITRARDLNFLLTIHMLPRLEQRLLCAFWHLADRCGRVTQEGVLVPLRLTHAQLAQLIGAQRPSTSTTIGSLRKRGLLRQTQAGWILLDQPPELASPASP